jgi:hypothetical protein
MSSTLQVHKTGFHVAKNENEYPLGDQARPLKQALYIKRMSKIAMSI